MPTFVCKPIDQEDEPEDPGPCPTFIFMPSKAQLIKMIIKAAYADSYF